MACPNEEVVLAYVEARLSEPERQSLEAHLGGCEDCGALVAAVTSSWHAEGRLGPPAHGERPALRPGDRLGPYTITALAGRGGAGEVYRAHDERLGRDVAVKTLPARFAADPDRLARFRLEARATSSAAHPNIVTIFDVGAHEGIPYLVTEWLQGRTLRARLAEGALPASKVLELGVQLAQGLAAAHERGVLHCDLKPANIFLVGEQCKILDFGLARLLGALESGEAEPRGISGTPGYMAPEQVRGEAVDHRSDLFALGAVLFEMSTGSPVFGGATAIDRLSATLRDDPPAAPGELGPLIQRCLARSPAARFQSASDLAFLLQTLARRPPGPQTRPALAAGGRRPWPALGALALLVLGAGGVLGRALLPPNRPLERPSYTPLTFGRGQLMNARFTSDPRVVIYGAAWDGGATQLYTARTERPGSQPLGLAADPLAVSPRGEVALMLAPRFLDTDHGSGTLARWPLSGGTPRPVAEDVEHADFAPDGATLAIVRLVGGGYALEYPPGTVRWQTQAWISHARVQGERIAFLLHPDPKDDRGAVHLLDGPGEPRRISGDYASARGLAWRVRGEESEVWFSASPIGADYAIYAADLRGHVRLVDRVAGRLQLHDIAGDGSVLADHQAVRMGLTVVDGDGERDLTWSDSSFLTDLSADGRWLVFSDGGASEGPEYGAYLRRTDGAPPLRLGDGLPLALSFDGHRVVVLRHGPPLRLDLLSSGTSAPRPLPLGGLAVVLQARFFPDDQRLILRGAEGGRDLRLWLHELTAPPRAITAEGDDPVVAIAADGSRFAGIDRQGTLRLYSPRGEALGVVPGRFLDQTLLAWSADGSSLFVRTRALPVRVHRVDVQSGAAVEHLRVPPGVPRPGQSAIPTLFISADGRTVAYSDAVTLSRLYLIQGLEPR